MDKIRIRGGKPLAGTIRIGGAKNAALKLMAAALLTEEPVSLSNLPALADIKAMAGLLEQHGVAIEWHKPGPDQTDSATLIAGELSNTTAPYDLVRKMRASISVLGPLLARCGKATVSLPGGCAIGPRPVNLHIEGLTALGAEIDIAGGYIHAAAPNGLVGAGFRFPIVSVGATENLLMAATLAQGETVLENAAREPEVADLARCLSRMGADIDGIGTDTLTIRGVERLRGAEYRVMPDRIETGTYAVAAAISGGDIELVNTELDLVSVIGEALSEAGVSLTPTSNGIRVQRNGSGLDGVDIMTQPFPGFPTDMQAQMMALMTTARGAAMITETIFENRFMHVPELLRMGSNITVHGASALVRGVEELKGAPVMATDLRASVSLVLAGLAATGETTISRVYHIDRGYERIEEKLAACGADIERLSD